MTESDLKMLDGGLTAEQVRELVKAADTAKTEYERSLIAYRDEQLAAPGIWVSMSPENYHLQWVMFRADSKLAEAARPMAALIAEQAAELERLRERVGAGQPERGEG